MQINARILNDILIIDIFGEFELYQSSKIRETLEGKIKENFKKVIINLENVTFVDTSGIKTLINCDDTIRENKGILKLVKVPGSVDRIFELTKLNNVFSIYKNEEEAIKSFA